MECGAFANARKRYLKTSNMKNILENVHMDDVISFLREAGLFLKNITPGHNCEATYQTIKYKCYWYIAIFETIKFLQVKLAVRNIATWLWKRN